MRRRRSPPLPPGETEESLLRWMTAIPDARTDARVREELATYLRTELRRFLFTVDLVPPGRGRLLEVGADPYFTTALLRRFRDHELFLTNGSGERPVDNPVPLPGLGCGAEALRFARFNLEADSPPFPEAPFDVVLCCEVIEHMTSDPVQALATLNETLRAGGHLILTTPNAARLGVAVNSLAGVHGTHDQYSAYGPYGRHSREYTPGEMKALLRHAGFEIEEAFTADVAPAGRPGPYPGLAAIQGLVGWILGAARWTLCAVGLLPGPPAGLGSYLFFRVRKVGAPSRLKPAWLYRSFPAEEMTSSNAAR
jgi:SAM-dependent methyltransferase